MCKCPKCGAMLVTRYMWHSCGRATLADWQARMGPNARAFYQRFEQMIAACGTYYVAPAKTRIAFLAQVRFANITELNESEIVCTFALPKRVRSARVVEIEEIIPAWCVHHLRITDVRQLDDEVQAWIRESYRLMGMRERLRNTAKSRRTTKRLSQNPDM
jgi:hypothetical protein